jgi:uncharacterized membrane protein
MGSEDKPRHFLDANLQGNLIAGMLTITPLVVVWLVFDFFLNALSAAARPVADSFAVGIGAYLPWAMPWMMSGTVRWCLAVAVSLLVLYSIGAIASRVAGQKALGFFERVIARVPMVETIYTAAKKLIDVLRQPPGGKQRVVLIDFPQEGMKTLGFVMRTFPDSVTGEMLASVYVPTAINPTCGYLQIAPWSRLIPTDISPDQAMTMVLSGGAVTPDNITLSAERAALLQESVAAPLPVRPLRGTKAA